MKNIIILAVLFGDHVGGYNGFVAFLMLVDVIVLGVSPLARTQPPPRTHLTPTLPSPQPAAAYHTFYFYQSINTDLTFEKLAF